MDEQTLKLLIRIFNTEDGKDLIQYIMKLRDQNYKEWKLSGGDVFRGKAICYDEIISLFETSSTKLENQKVVQQDWH